MKKEKQLAENAMPVSRRGFIKAMSAVAAAATLAGCSDSDNNDDFQPDTNAPDLREVRKVYSTCPVECLTHSLNCQLVGDQVIRVEPTRKPGDLYFTTACGRGMSRMQFLTENRVATPMKRIKKGTAVSPLGVVLKNNAIDEWQSISWEQAINEVGAKLKALRDNGEDRSVLVNTGSGNMGPVSNSVIGTFFAHAAPNRTAIVGNMCCQGVDDGMKVTYGARGIDTRDTIRDSKCIICWGNNPADTSSTYWKFFIDAKEAGAKIIVIDPRYSKSAERADQWIPIKPGTDTLFAIGMLRHIFANDVTGGGSETWIDEDFLKHRTNAPYLVDISDVRDDDGTLIDLTNPAQKPWNKLYNLKYYTVDDKPCVYSGGAIVKAEKNTGRNSMSAQDPNLYYTDGSTVATAYQIMRALYAGDILGGAPVASELPASLTNLHDPYYTEYEVGTPGATGYIPGIINVAGLVEGNGNSSLQPLIDCAEAYASSGKKSMIIENMGGVTRTESGGQVCALHCMLSLITGNIGDRGNGVDDTSGYSSLAGYQTGDPAKVNTGLSFTMQAPGAGTTYPIPFGVLGQRTRDANNNTPQNRFLAGAGGAIDPQIKFWYIATLNLLTQYPNTDALKEALCSTEMVVVAKPTWNTDADYSDYYLPVTTPFEYEDLGAGNRNKYVQMMEAGVKPYGQSRSDMQIMRGLAKVVFADAPAVAADFDNNDTFYVEKIINTPGNNFVSNGIATYDVLKSVKTIRPSSIPSPWVPHHNHEFLGAQAINGRAKIFITDWQYKAVTDETKAKELATSTAYPYWEVSPNPAKNLYRGPFPRYVPALESQLPLLPDFTAVPQAYQSYRSNYKLACVQMKTSRSVHASFTGLPWIREAFGEQGLVYMHPEDALPRGIYDGEKVTVKSHTGAVERIAKVTTLIMKGVTAIENGWWDKYGPVSSSTVGAELPCPMGCGHTHNNTLVEVFKGGME